VTGVRRAAVRPTEPRWVGAVAPPRRRRRWRVYRVGAVGAAARVCVRARVQTALHHTAAGGLATMNPRAPTRGGARRGDAGGRAARDMRGAPVGLGGAWWCSPRPPDMQSGPAGGGGAGWHGRQCHPWPGLTATAARLGRCKPTRLTRGVRDPAWTGSRRQSGPLTSPAWGARTAPLACTGWPAAKKGGAFPFFLAGGVWTPVLRPAVTATVGASGSAMRPRAPRGGAHASHARRCQVRCGGGSSACATSWLAGARTEERRGPVSTALT